MNYKISAPDRLEATVNLPASKSISNRVLVIQALAGGQTVPDNLSDCDDTQVIVRALHDMPYTIDIKAAGTAMRFLTAYLSVTEGEHVITGTERMKHRPISLLVDALRRLGADITYEGEEGFPPLRIRGNKLRGGTLELSGNVSSQYISALLMIGPLLQEGLQLRLTGNIISRPYIDLTLCAMRNFGADAEWTDIDTIVVKCQPYVWQPFHIENDWSAASYWYAAMAMSRDNEAEIRLNGLMDGSHQGDSVIRYLFNMLGVRTLFKDKEQGVITTVTLKRCASVLPRLDYDFINQPDMVQTFVVCCAMMNIPFTFKGLGSLKIKETDRVQALITEMRKLGYVIDEPEPGTLSWNGERCEAQPHAVIDTYEDHRMAMAFAPAALLLGDVRIRQPQVVTKSYPHYWDDLRQAGFTLTPEED